MSVSDARNRQGEHYNYMPKKSEPILYSNLLHKKGQDFLDIQYTSGNKVSTIRFDSKTIIEIFVLS